MSIKKVTPLELIEETYQYYVIDSNPRAIGKDGKCKYLDEETGNMCAVGRCAVDPGAMEKFSEASNGITIEGFGREFYTELKPEYQDIPLGLWDLLQCWHDDYKNLIWDNEGKITQEGIDSIEDLKVRYS